MLYELRTYAAMPGRMADLHRRFTDLSLDAMARHGFTVVGLWTNELGGPSDELIYLLAWDSLAEREQKWAALGRDRDFWAAFAATETNGRLVEHATAHVLRPTAYSPMR